MVFITEQNLRDLYGKQAFETFTLVEGERLTPGARQFLADRQISIIDPADVKPYKTATIQIDGSEEYTSAEEAEPEHEAAPEPAAEAAEQPAAAECSSEQAAASVVKNVLDNGNERLRSRFGALQALYLKQATEIYAQNQTLANEIFDMECSLCSIEAGSDLNILVPGVCNGMNAEDLKVPQRECFQMTRAILLANHGTEAAVLHYLRSETYRFYYENAEELSQSQKVHIAYLINLCSQMIHKAIGGTLCQRLQK